MPIINAGGLQIRLNWLNWANPPELGLARVMSTLLNYHTPTLLSTLKKKFA
jgi:hypothetical protein